MGTPIPLFSSAKLSVLKTQKPIVLMGGIHGDEPEGVALANATLNWLKECTIKGIELAPWILIPCLNVDGFRAETRVNGRGVDLNRNYPSKDWSPAFDKPRYYPGPSPSSEPEIQGIVELVEEFHPRLMIHCHSWEPCIVCSGEPALEDARRLSKNSGYKLVDTIGYPTPGSLSGYGWIDNKIPVICIEEQEKQPDLNTIWPRFSEAMQAVFTDLSLRQAGEN